MVDESSLTVVSAALADLILKEIPLLLASGQNWKLVINGNSAGDVSTVIEQHCPRVKRFEVLSASN